MARIAFSAMLLSAASRPSVTKRVSATRRLMISSVMTGGGVAGGLNHAIKQRARVASARPSALIPLWRNASANADFADRLASVVSTHAKNASSSGSSDHHRSRCATGRRRGFRHDNASNGLRSVSFAAIHQHTHTATEAMYPR
jgi:hypothetical protein